MVDLDTAYRAYAIDIRKYVARRVAPSDIDDVCGAVWLSVVRGAPAYAERGHRLTAWLYRIAQSRCVDAQRHARRDRTVPLDACTIATSPPAEPPDLAWFAALPEHWRAALWLRALGYAPLDAAPLLKTTTDGYRAMLWRARQAAKEAAP